MILTWKIPIQKETGSHSDFRFCYKKMVQSPHSDVQKSGNWEIL